MGKPKSHSSKARQLARKKGLKDGQQQNTAGYTMDQLLDKAGDLLDEYKYELAQKFCQRALELDADNVRALEMSGNLLLEVGQVEGAQQCLGRAIHLAPESGHTKYMTAAQLFSGTEARDLYLKGVEILERTANSDTSDDSVGRELSTALVAVSELYMTDLCDSEEAETESRRFIDLAVQADSGNSEAWQALANYHLVTENIEGAQEAMSTSLELWLPQHLSWVETGEGKQTSLSYNSRLGTVKMLLDLEDFDRATEVLDSLVEEDDEVVAPYYLLGWLNFLRDDPDYHGNVRHYLTKAKQVNTMNPTDDEGMVAHIDEILAEVGEGSDEDREQLEDLTLEEDDPEKAAKIADILDRDKEDETEDMED